MCRCAGDRCQWVCLLPQIVEMPEHNPGQMGATMRLGKRKTVFTGDSLASESKTLWLSPLEQWHPLSSLNYVYTACMNALYCRISTVYVPGNLCIAKFFTSFDIEYS